MKARELFYKPRDTFGHIISGWTGLFCWGSKSCCHEERGYFFDEDLIKYVRSITTLQQKVPDTVGWWYYSSTSRNRTGDDKKSNGTRWIKGQDLLKNPERWFCYEGDPERPIRDEIQDTCDLLGCGYDFLGLAGFVTIFGQLNSKAKWYCSEICKRLASGKWDKRVSPRQNQKRIAKVLKWKEVKI